MIPLKEQFETIVRNEDRLMKLLLVAREYRLPDWYIAAGAIRNTVWDVLHGYGHRTPLHDVDLVYCNTATIDHRPDIDIWRAITKKVSQVTWNVVNQARAHILNGCTPPVSSTCERTGAKHQHALGYGWNQMIR